jgi:hypothetical protein
MISDIKNYLTYGAVTLIIAIIGGYTLFQLRHLIEGPRITFLKPLNGVLVHNSIFSLEGVAQNVKEVQIDDRPAFINETGKFTDTILLSVGYNVIRVTGKDKFNRKTEQQIEVIYKKSEPGVATNNIKTPKGAN